MARKRANGVKLSVQPGKGYKKFIRGHMFYLGHDEAIATRLALDIIERSKVLKATNRKWTTDDLAEISVLKEIAYDPSLRTPASEIIEVLEKQGIVYDDRPEPEPRVLIAPEGSEHREDAATTLYEAVESFRGHINASQSRSEAWKSECSYRLDLIGDATADMPLADFKFDAIGSILDTWIGHVRQGRWAASSATGYMATLRQFLNWADASDSVAWMAPRHWNALIRQKKKQLRMLASKSSPDGSDRYFTLEELTDLYAAANAKQRTLMLLGLNCGFLQSDIASIEIDMVKCEDGVHYIERDRQKTGVYGRWALWPETAEHLMPFVKEARKRKDTLVFRTGQGRPLVWRENNGNRIDSVYQTWRRLLRAAGVAGRNRSFKHLRKTASHMLRSAASHEVAEMFLAHELAGDVARETAHAFDGRKEQGVGTHYHEFTRWDRVAAALDRLRQDLQPMFEGVKSGDDQ